MVFSSPIFLFYFLPIFLIGYHLAFLPAQLARDPESRRRLVNLANAFLLLASLLFYFWGETWLTLVMLGSTTIDFISGLLIARSTRSRVRKALLSVSILANLLVLSFFKYANFGLDNINHLAGTVGLSGLQMPGFMEVALPLGISFYTFQSMSYTIDVYRGDVQPTRNFLGFACFVTMFPQLVAGPIVRYRNVAAQINQRILSIDLFSSGCIRFIVGLGKKVLISNLVAVPADKIFALPADQLTTGLAWLGVLSYTLQIYFDFSGYSDMAIGLGRMLGFHFPENFNYPYSARSIQDFWRRWHISLSSWFRDYLYIPLGGSRGNPARVYFNLAAVFILCGLWHGASWTFVIWGLYHGLFLVAERLGLGRMLQNTWRPLANAYVLLTIMGSWVLFRAENMEQAASFYKAMAGFATATGTENTAAYLTPETVTALVCGGILAWPVLLWFRRLREGLRVSLEKWGLVPFGAFYGLAKVTGLLAVLLFSCTALASGSYNPFIYFRF
ncbi:MAG: alginate O-acetyltransferase complex protein AlgI [Candidatus Krumholzibacteriia bacterium]|jgi:alginate O-acetyltransferase complex protein AlgI